MSSSNGKSGQWVSSDRPIFVAKRTDRVADRVAKPRPIDGRTLRKIKRYRQELKRGRRASGQRLLPFEIAVRVDFLLDHGDRVEQIRKLIRPKKIDYDEEQVRHLVEEMQSVCGFHPEAYLFAGVRNETLEAAGLW